MISKKMHNEKTMITRGEQDKGLISKKIMFLIISHVTLNDRPIVSSKGHTYQTRYGIQNWIDSRT